VREWLARLVHRLKVPRSTIVRVTGAQSLAPGLAVYALDVDGRRIIVGASAHGLCVLDRYQTPKSQNPAGPSNPRG
jgi:hypothetical protein